MKTLRVLAALLPLLLLGAGWKAVGVTVNKVEAGGAAPTQSLNDQFSDDATGWTADNGFVASGCSWDTGWIDCQSDGSNGNVRQTGDDDGTNPSTQDQWAVLDFETGIHDQQGIGLLNTNTEPGTTDHNFIFRCSPSDEFQFRICDFGDACTDVFLSTVTTCVANLAHDQLAFAHAGIGDATEMCGWFWPAGDADESDWSNPLTWKDPQVCISKTLPITLLSEFSGAGTTESAWTCDPDDCDSGSKGYPATGNKTIIIYDGAGTAVKVNWIRAGDLNL